MNSKTTGLWFVIAASLFAFIFLFERSLRPHAGSTREILPQLELSEVTAIQIVPAGALEIRAEKTNGAWNLVEPVKYPAQTAAIESLLGALQKLVPAVPKISASELASHKDSEAEFGFDPPRYSIKIEAGDKRWQLSVGSCTAPGDQVFLRLIGVDGAYVADAGWLQSIPRSPNDWRNTSLANAGADCDWIAVTNNARGIKMQFQRDPTNRLWHIVSPLLARADSTQIETALQKLLNAHATAFLDDNPRTDLTALGLQPPDLDVWAGNGSNLVTALHIGRPLTNDASQVFVQREGWTTISSAAADQFAVWRGTVNDFRDLHLLDLTAPPGQIDFLSGSNHYALQRHGSNDWTIAGENFPADPDSIREYIQLLAGFKVSDFVQDVVTPHDLQTFGLATPAREIALYATAGDTNSLITRLLFSTTVTNEVLVKRADENFVYGLSASDYNRIPEQDWEFRDRNIWHFAAKDVAQVTLHQAGQTRQLVRSGENKWTLAVGSQGIITGRDLEQAMDELGSLTAEGWVGRHITAPEKYGLDTNNLSITVELKNGEKHTVDFGLQLPRAQTALASVTLDGERWAFVFPPVTFQFVLSYLTIPANVP